MFAQAHKFVGEKVMEELKFLEGYHLHRKRFLWGNVKPDFVPELLVQKHYIDEMFPLVVSQIWKLSTYSYDWLSNPNKKQRFDEELGVICHFLSDFFCVPHNKRWEFKHSMKPHIQYENTLNQKMNDYRAVTTTHLKQPVFRSEKEVELYLKEALEDYETKQDYLRDYQYSIEICTRMSLFIIRSILSHSFEQTTPAFINERSIQQSKHLKILKNEKATSNKEMTP